MHLRCASQRVGVLHRMVGRSVAGHDLRTGQQTAEVGRAPLLAGVGPDRMQLRAVGGVGAEQCLDGDGAGHVGGGGQPVEVGHRQAQVGQHPLGAVEERKALLGLQHDGLQPGGGQGVGTRQPPAVVGQHLPRPDEDGADVSQGRQIAGGAEAAQLGDGRSHPGPQQTDEPVDQRRPDARQPGGQRPGPEQHHRPDHLGLDQIAHPGGVTEHQRQLQPARLVGRHLHRRQRSEPGGDAVDGGAVGHDPLDHGSGGSHALGRLRRHGAPLRAGRRPPRRPRRAANRRGQQPAGGSPRSAASRPPHRRRYPTGQPVC